VQKLLGAVPNAGANNFWGVRTSPRKSVPAFKSLVYTTKVSVITVGILHRSFEGFVRNV
jgi:hypothetical protein